MEKPIKFKRAKMRVDPNLFTQLAREDVRKKDYEAIEKYLPGCSREDLEKVAAETHHFVWTDEEQTHLELAVGTWSASRS